MVSEENRETFFARLNPLFSPSTLERIKLAYILSKAGHRHQTRKETDAEGNPVRYFEHPRRVALILIDEAKCARPEMIMAALLHDTIEDTRDLTPEMIDYWFGEEVAGLVRILSKVPKDGYVERLVTHADWRALMIKACDRLDNLRSMHCCTEEFLRKQLDETREKYFRVFDRMMDLASERGAPGVGARYLRNAIRKIVADHEKRFPRPKKASKRCR